MAEAAVEEKQEQQTDSKTEVKSVNFSEVNGSEVAATSGSIDFLLDMNVTVTVTIGKRNMTIRRLLQLGPGSILKLDKPVDVPADLYIKDTKFATGSIVVVDGRFAVRIKNIVGLGETDVPVESQQDSQQEGQQEAEKTAEQ
ncbi:MAG: FliM/FliN family flagellar motor switch protein [Planctomycetota bacterium]|jgi:flagellar motor switch protein FliN/FliY